MITFQPYYEPPPTSSAHSAKPITSTPVQSNSVYRLQVLNTLCDIINNQSYANWDGYQALPASIESYQFARCVVLALPFNIPDPEVDLDPDGDILLDWSSGPDNIFSMSIGSNGVISYAGLWGLEKKYGNILFSDGRLPQIIHESIRRTFKSK